MWGWGGQAARNEGLKWAEEELIFAQESICFSRSSQGKHLHLYLLQST